MRERERERKKERKRERERKRGRENSIPETSAAMIPHEQAL